MADIKGEETPTDVTNTCETMENEAGESCTVGNSQLELDSEKQQTVSKRQLKKMAKRQKWEAEKAKYWAIRNEIRKKRRLEKKEKFKDGPPPGKPVPFSRNSLKKMNKRLQPSNFKVCIDLSFDLLMVEHNIKKMMKQIESSYSLNRRSKSRLQMFVTSFNGESERIMMLTRPGCVNWDVTLKKEDYDEVFSKESIVYLSSESPNVLDVIDESKVYVIGGLIDRNQHKGLCYKLATEKGIETARLPINEHIVMQARKVLAVNHVFHLLLLVAEGCTWTEALLKVMPKRKGAEALMSDEEDDDERQDESTKTNKGTQQNNDVGIEDDAE